MVAVLLDANMEKLHKAAWDTYRREVPAAARFALPNMGKWDLNGLCRRHFGREVNECFDDLLMLVGAHNFQPLFGGTLTTPDHADFALTDIDARWLGSFADWSPGTSNQMIGQWPAAPQASWVASVHPNQHPRLAVSTDGTAFGNTEHNVAYPFEDGHAYWVRQTYDTRATDRICRYYWAPPTLTGVPTEWNEIGSGTVDSGAVIPFNSTGLMAVAWAGFGTNCRFYAAEVRSGIDGTIVCNPDVRNKPTGTSSFTDGTGKLWTVGGFGAIR